MIDSIAFRSPALLALRATTVAAASLLFVACGGSSDSPPGRSTGSGSDSGISPDAGTGVSPDDASSHPNDDSGSAPPPPKGDGGAVVEEDSGVNRNAVCTPLSAQTGTLVNTSHGRLDGTLVFIVPVGGPGKCNGDDSHVHLQIEVSGLVYDVAVDVGATGDEVGMYQQTIAPPGGAWSEGWHGTDPLAYSSLGLDVSQFPLTDPATIAAQVTTALDSTSKISIFCTGYTQGDGCHDVHYENDTNDGAILLDPTAAQSPVLFFRFQDQTKF